ncbi:MAG: helicase [Burkholderiaceae bacterium]|nr:helicase [Burkholderiaceae bacterium]
MSQPDAVDAERVLGALKGFQRKSVAYVYERLYGKGATRRFLLADEVGLGKTLVARGVIARAIERLRKAGKKRIDVIYICSNADIARQNISRLNVTGKPDFQFASRITLLPQQVQELSANRLNFVSFTPQTSFHLGNRGGLVDERLLLYWLLRWTWPSIAQGTGAKNLMQGGVTDKDKFRDWLRQCERDAPIDRDLAKAFSEQLRQEGARAREAGKPTHESNFRDLCARFAWSKKHIPAEDREARNAFIGDMRSLLAAVCVRALEPDLIILDEFQRFKDLLRPDNPAGDLARHLFAWEDARVLLLSATPYKMYTLGQEAESDDHYKDFVETLRFLQVDEKETEASKELLAAYGRACARVGQDGVEPVREIKQKLEAELRRVMCRTEKLAVTADRSGMLREVATPAVQVLPKHIESYLATRRLADALGHTDVTEYWKASPYLLNFMEPDNYQLKGLLRDVAQNGGGEAVSRAIAASRSALLDASAWRAYEEIDPRHAALERLAEQTIGEGWWRLLWMPPSFPYYRLGQPFSGVAAKVMTKRLIFSSWNVVPRAVSVLLSYEVERRMMKSLDAAATNTLEARERRRPLLMFTRSEGRLTGMPVLSLLYPSTRLAGLGDPLGAVPTVATETLEAVIKKVAGGIRKLLSPLTAGARRTGPEDEAWYWAAPIMLDRHNDREATEGWFANPASLADAWSSDPEERKGWLEHVGYAAEFALGKAKPEGRVPEDLPELLALIAIAGPANCALRALGHTLGAAHTDPALRHSAGRTAWGFRSLFNTPEVIALIRGMNGAEPYWRRALEYCAAGCLQSVLDEYVHVLVESEGLTDAPPIEAARQLADKIASSAGLRAATPGVDWVRASSDGRVTIDNQRARARFAMRYGDERGGEREETLLRKEGVRAAFNSPFWPFVCVTTSIGQEGLDFHPYCHAVVHWNLPSNPVDLEQREGRVHRYKGHAVRKNVASLVRKNGHAAKPGVNPWGGLFEYAEKHAGHSSEIVPYWVFPIEDGAYIERHAPALPLSREAARLPALRGSLAVYRMVFGQPRQEDLLEHLKRTVAPAELAKLSREFYVNLEPPTVK